MVTISNLRRALLAPDRHFRRLKNLTLKSDDIRRSTIFAEVEAECEGKRFLLLMPLTSFALSRIEQFITHKHYLHHSIVPRIEILRDEMLTISPLGGESYCDIVIEALPQALPFKDALATAHCDAQYATTLLGSLNTLRSTLHNGGFSHNNLRVENMFIDHNDRLYPIRWYYATSETGGDDEALNKIEEELQKSASSNLLCDVEPAPYDTPLLLDGHITTGQMSEGLIRVEDEGGWGFVDCHNRYVIEPQYIWANDFREGRAEVETTEGMGLIDKQGNHIIPPRYKVVDYNPHRGESLVNDGSGWALFDYFGRQLCPFGEIEPIV
jgi:hypothetical protein